MSQHNWSRLTSLREYNKALTVPVIEEICWILVMASKAGITMSYRGYHYISKWMYHLTLPLKWYFLIKKIRRGTNCIRITYSRPVTVFRRERKRKNRVNIWPVTYLLPCIVDTCRQVHWMSFLLFTHSLVLSLSLIFLFLSLLLFPVVDARETLMKDGSSEFIRLCFKSTTSCFITQHTSLCTFCRCLFTFC